MKSSLFVSFNYKIIYDYFYPKNINISTNQKSKNVYLNANISNNTVSDKDIVSTNEDKTSLVVNN